MVSCLIGRKMSNFKYHQKNILNPMSIHKITPFSLGYQNVFFKNSDMTAAMQNISFILSRVKK